MTGPSHSDKVENVLRLKVFLPECYNLESLNLLTLKFQKNYTPCFWEISKESRSLKKCAFIIACFCFFKYESFFLSFGSGGDQTRALHFIGKHCTQPQI
jgi:hypothetical protein